MSLSESNSQLAAGIKDINSALAEAAASQRGDSPRGLQEGYWRQSQRGVLCETSSEGLETGERLRHKAISGLVGRLAHRADCGICGPQGKVRGSEITRERLPGNARNRLDNASNGYA